MSKKFIISFIALFLWLAVVFPVFAQDKEIRNQVKDEAYRKKIEDLSKCGPRPGAPGNWVCKNGGWRTEVNDSVMPLPRKDVRIGLKQSVNINEKRIELNTQLKEAQEAAKKRLETVREEAKKVTETFRMELKDKISKLRDEKKKQVATRLDEQMASFNAQWTDHFNNVLSRLSEILSKVELRADKAKAAGRDVVAAQTAIQNAKNAIATAHAAVETQAKKTYSATFSSEKELGAAFKAVRERLHKDLFGLRDGAMKSAREAVQNALQALRGVSKVDEEPKATTTPSQ